MPEKTYPDRLVEPVHRPRGRPRDANADKVIIEATLELLADGTDIVSLPLEAIASKAKVGKATIYRRWPTKQALIADAVAALDVELPDLPGTSLRADLVCVVQSLRPSDEQIRADRVLPCITVLGRSDPEIIGRFFRIVMDRRRELVAGALERAVARGEARPDTDPGLLTQLLVSTMIAYNMVTPPGEPAPSGFAESVVDMVLNGVGTRPSARE